MSVSLDGHVAPIDGSGDWVAAGRSDDGLRWTVETVSNAGPHLVDATTYAGWSGYWPGASGPFAKPMKRDPQGRVPGPACVRRLGGDDDRRRRSGRSRHAAQAGTFRRIPARPRRLFTSSLAISRWAPPSSAAEPSPTYSRRTCDRGRSATGERRLSPRCKPVPEAPSYPRRVSHEAKPPETGCDPLPNTDARPVAGGPNFGDGAAYMSARSPKFARGASAGCVPPTTAIVYATPFA
jgi:hypothetical protein